MLTDRANIDTVQDEVISLDDILPSEEKTVEEFLGVSNNLIRPKNISKYAFPRANHKLFPELDKYLQNV